MVDFETARSTMVECQVRTSDVTDHPLLSALSTVHRERFVPGGLRPLAYIDRDLCIKEAATGSPPRYLMQPASFARLVQLAEVGSNDKVLDVGTGTGYGAAVLARLAKTVVGLECDPDLASGAERALQAEGATNTKIVLGPLAAGCPSEAPYDVIIFDGSVEAVPPAFYEQLSEGGRLACVVGRGGSALATIVMKMGGELSHRASFNAAVQPLPGFERKREFVF